MTPSDLRRAAYWLTVNAEALKDCVTIDGRWSEDEQEAKAEHAECVALAKKLRKMARASA